MPSLIFKIVTQKTVDINISEQAMLTYPVHEHYLIEAKEIVVIYKYNPTKKTANNIEDYIKYLTGFLKRKYKAYSVVYGGLQEQLKQN